MVPPMVYYSVLRIELRFNRFMTALPVWASQSPSTSLSFQLPLNYKSRPIQY